MPKQAEVKCTSGVSNGSWRHDSGLTKTLFEWLGVMQKVLLHLT